MRVTFVLPEFNLNGGIRVVATHAAWLARQGHQVLAIATRPWRPAWQTSLKNLLRGRPWPPPFDPNKPSHFDGLPVEHRYVPHNGPVTDADVPDADVVIATWWETAPMVHALSPRKGAKVHFVQGYEIFVGDPQTVNAAYALPLAKIVVSGWLAGIIRDKFHQEPMALVLNSVDTHEFQAPPRGKQAVPTVGHFYARERIKGTDLCFQAFELARQKVPNLRLVLLSNAPVVPELPLPEGTEWVFQARGSQLPEYLARCDAWLWTSREEGFGLPLLEASACRTPVIATPAGAAPEILAKGGGILVPPENPAAIAEAIVKICSLPASEWQALSEQALAAVRGFTWDDASRLFAETLEGIVRAGAKVSA
jgi:glycosyltransferase involved in cell wall biosynthesis